MYFASLECVHPASAPSSNVSASLSALAGAQSAPRATAHATRVARAGIASSSGDAPIGSRANRIARRARSHIVWAYSPAIGRAETARSRGVFFARGGRFAGRVVFARRGCFSRRRDGADVFARRDGATSDAPRRAARARCARRRRRRRRASASASASDRAGGARTRGRREDARRAATDGTTRARSIDAR